MNKSSRIFGTLPGLFAGCTMFLIPVLAFADGYIITTIAGGGTSSEDGTATFAKLIRPTGVATDSSGTVYIADAGGNRVQKIDPSGFITAIAGNGTRGYTGEFNGTAVAAQLSDPRGVAVDTARNIYIADTGNYRIRKVDTAGFITSIAGGGAGPTLGDGGTATFALLNAPGAVAVDPAGNIYVADTAYNRIRRIDAFGTITTVAGAGRPGYSGDQSFANAAQLNKPCGVAIDLSGNIYAADTANNRVRKIDPAGIITTAAGDGKASYGGDGGAAANAQLNNPCGVATDLSGNVYIADTANNRVRKIDNAGIITTIAGDGTRGTLGDGADAAFAQLNGPAGIAVDSSGNIYIADTDNELVRKLSPVR